MKRAYVNSLIGGNNRMRIARLLFVTVFLTLTGWASAEEARAAKVIRSIRDNPTGGDCTLVGTWNASTKTCTLTGNTTDLFTIDSDYVTLDGNGYTLTGTNTGMDRYETGAGIAVNVVGRTGVTVRNLKITRFDYGVDLYDTNDSTVTGVTATYSAWSGISLTNAQNNTLTNNVIRNNSIDTGICIGFASSNNIVSGNTISATERGIYVHTYCVVNDISNNTFSSNVHALSFVEHDTSNSVTSNTFSANQIAVLAQNGSNNNTMTTNTVINNGTGFRFENVTGNLVAANTITDNTLQANVTGGGANNFNRSLAGGGGNRWSNYDAPAEGCVDAGGDGFCDSAYSFSGGVDNFPQADPASQSTGGDCQKPMLRLLAPNPYWANYNDYEERRLSSNLAIENYGATPAYLVSVFGTVNTNGVTALTPMPIQLGLVSAATTKPFTVQFLVPNGVQSFKSTMYTTATVGCDTTYSFPDSAPPA